MSDLQALFGKAVTLHQQNRLDEAKSLYLEVLQAVPDNLNVLANIAIVYRDLGELDTAEKYCRKIVNRAPDDPAQHLNLGAVLEAKNNLDEARASYQKGLELAPGHPKLLNNLGKLLHQQGNVDEGLRLLEKALEIEPDYPLALNNLGVIYSEKGDLSGAEQCLQKSVALDPVNVQALYNLAGVYNGLNNVEKARNILQKLIDLDSSHKAANHMLSALSGETTPTAPREYVEETFDKYAHRFDAHIQQQLKYTVPKVLADIVVQHLKKHLPFAKAVDLGCGTGLSAAPFTDLATSITGVDISSKMLEKAKEKKIYDDTQHQEILPFLQQTKEKYDLFIAADVLIYLGDPEAIFPLMEKKSTDNAVFACSIESTEETHDFKLQQSGRYGHNPVYFENIARENGFFVVHRRPHNIRKEDNVWIPGFLYVLQKGT